MDDGIEEVQELSQQTLAISNKYKHKSDIRRSPRNAHNKNKESWAMCAIKNVINTPYRLFKGNAVKNANNQVANPHLNKE
jgi:hypothetical protein